MPTTQSGSIGLVVVGGANYDYLVLGQELPTPGETIHGDQFFESPGGKGANQAVAAARLGVKVAFVACLGDDERGDKLLARLNEEGVDTQHLVRNPHAATGVALVHVNQKGQKQILAFPGANSRLEVSHLPERVITSARALLVQLEVPLSVVETAIWMAHEAGVKVILDPAPPAPLSNELLSQVDLLKPDAKEAEALTGVQVEDRSSARRAADQLLQRGVGAVMIEAGGEGNLLAWKDGESWNPLLPVETVDTTGAGDAMAAALAVSLVQGQSLEDAGRFANAAAAYATTAFGAQAALPRRGDIESLLRRYRQ